MVGIASRGSCHVGILYYYKQAFQEQIKIVRWLYFWLKRSSQSYFFGTFISCSYHMSLSADQVQNRKIFVSKLNKILSLMVNNSLLTREFNSMAIPSLYCIPTINRTCVLSANFDWLAFFSSSSDALSPRVQPHRLPSWHYSICDCTYRHLSQCLYDAQRFNLRGHPLV